MNSSESIHLWSLGVKLTLYITMTFLSGCIIVLIQHQQTASCFLLDESVHSSHMTVKIGDLLIFFCYFTVYKEYHNLPQLILYALPTVVVCTGGYSGLLVLYIIGLMVWYMVYSLFMLRMLQEVHMCSERTLSMWNCAMHGLSKFSATKMSSAGGRLFN